jgi:hypothetical protein
MFCYQANAGMGPKRCHCMLHAGAMNMMPLHAWLIDVYLTGPAGLAANDTWKKHLIIA